MGLVVGDDLSLLAVQLAAEPETTCMQATTMAASASPRRQLCCAAFVAHGACAWCLAWLWSLCSIAGAPLSDQRLKQQLLNAVQPWYQQCWCLALSMGLLAVQLAAEPEAAFMHVEIMEAPKKQSVQQQLKLATPLTVKLPGAENLTFEDLDDLIGNFVDPYLDNLDKLVSPAPSVLVLDDSFCYVSCLAVYGGVMRSAVCSSACECVLTEAAWPAAGGQAHTWTPCITVALDIDTLLAALLVLGGNP